MTPRAHPERLGWSNRSPMKRIGNPLARTGLRGAIQAVLPQIAQQAKKWPPATFPYRRQPSCYLIGRLDPPKPPSPPFREPRAVLQTPSAALKLIEALLLRPRWCRQRRALPAVS